MKARKRIVHDRVCSCESDGKLRYLAARELRRLVNSEMTAMMSTRDARRRYMRGLRAGLLCEESGHYPWALKIMARAQREVSNANWQWEEVEINRDYYTFDSLVASDEMYDLASRADRLARRLGCNEYAYHRLAAVGDYRMLWLCMYGEPYWEV